MTTWNPEDLQRTTPDPTLAMLDALDPWCWRIYNMLIGLGPIRGQDIAKAAAMPVVNVIEQLRKLRSLGLAISSTDHRQDRYRTWRVVPGGLRLSEMLDDADAHEGVRRWLNMYALNQQTLLREYIQRLEEEPDAWRGAVLGFEVVARLTAAELDELAEELYDVIVKWHKRANEAEESRPDARPVYIAANGIPLVGPTA